MFQYTTTQEQYSYVSAINFFIIILITSYMVINTKKILCICSIEALNNLFPTNETLG